MYYGFVYEITCTHNGKIYVGSKSLFKTNRIQPTPTTWRRYYGSSNHLKRDIELFGFEYFRREILSFHTCRGEMLGAETRKIIETARQRGLEGIYNKAYFSKGKRCWLHNLKGVH